MPKFLLSLLFICTTSMLWSQDAQQEKLEQRKAQIQQEIKENERLLQSVKKKEKSAVNFTSPTTLVYDRILRAHRGRWAPQ